jgi:hypothetical protein
MDHATQQEQYDAAGMSTGNVVTTVRRLRGQRALTTDPDLSLTARQVLENMM